MVETNRAVRITEQFEVSRQFWAHQVREGRLSSHPQDFINATPHMSFVWGDANIEFLRKRHAALVQQPDVLRHAVSTDQEQIRQWAPLLIEGRDPQQKVAATYMPLGTDVNFGVITNQLTAALQNNPISSSICNTKCTPCAENRRQNLECNRIRFGHAKEKP